ncbi:ABC-type taurine transport system, periplasmic component [Mycolicibacterium aurum]|uniref:ABC-type taurine transport system, periplasmic component n=1 Tax=Mycolicibacterium aurum TaxID=1791 RepID=A0A3S5EIZ2_MYCAU|nr:ABC transporter substrate-binding protein [Mycolicibacterium aurum]VEG51823.1 ABC-type taurine transport system, periplasmic component [Mycolicibacterium aurum]
MKFTRIGAVVAVAALALAGCSSGSEGSQDNSTAPLKVAFASDLDPADIADYLGAQKAGAEITALNEDSAVVAGLQNGNFDIGNMDGASAIKAAQSGIDVKIVYVSQVIPEFVLVAQSQYQNIGDLAGARVAYHGPGSPTETLPRELARQTGPDLENQINWSVLPESPNRAAAMLGQQIDATALEFGDVLTLQDEGEFTVLGDWSDLKGDSASAFNTVWVTSGTFLESNRDRVVDFLTNVQTAYDEFYQDEAAWTAAVKEQLPDVREDFLPQIYQYYSEASFYPKAGTAPLSAESWAGMDAFFQSLGEYNQPADPSMVDFDVINEVSGAK